MLQITGIKRLIAAAITAIITENTVCPVRLAKLAINLLRAVYLTVDAPHSAQWALQKMSHCSTSVWAKQ